MIDLKDYQEYDYQDEFRIALNKKNRDRYKANYITATGVPVREAYKERARFFNLSLFTCEHCGESMNNGSRYRHLNAHRNYNNKSGKILPPSCKNLKNDGKIPEGKIKCECGRIIRDVQSDKNRHFKTIVHKKWEQFINYDMFDIDEQATT